MISPDKYVTEQFSTMIGAPVRLTQDQVKQGWALLAREEERGAPRDVNGNFDPRYSELWQRDQLEQPPLHTLVQTLAGQYVGTDRWPNGHRFAVCLTHDIDEIVKLPWRERWRQLCCLWKEVPLRQSIRWASGTAIFASGTVLGCSDLSTYDCWLQMDRQYGFHSTYFVLPEQLLSPTKYDHFYRYADRVKFQGHAMTFAEATRRVHQQGCEIGLQGSYASAFDARILNAEKAQVEEMLGAPIHSVRQHYLHFAVEKTPRVQEEAGFLADCTLGYSLAIGCRAGIAFPYFWPNAPDLLEIPLVIHDVSLLRKPDVRLDIGEAIARARALIARIAEIGGVVTLSWHTHPGFPGAHTCYRALLETIAEYDGWGCTVGELNAWWRARREVVRQAMSAGTGHPSENFAPTRPNARPTDQLEVRNGVDTIRHGMAPPSALQATEDREDGAG